MPRLYGRSRMAQALLDKQQFEDELANLDKSEWYAVNSLAFSESALANSFIQMGVDQETESFLEYCRDVSDSLCLQLFYDIASTVLSLFYTKTCINGMLGRGIMFLFSSAQLSRLLFDFTCNSSHLECEPSSSSMAEHRGAILDLGAGDGTITEKFRPHFDTLYATETSPVMQRRLKEKGIKLLPVDDWWRIDSDSTPRFRLISCLNLLDRHTKPLTLLRQLYDKAKADGALILIAAVLPWNQYVEYQVENVTNRGPNEPKEAIRINGNTFETQVSDFVAKVLEPNGFHVIRWTRLPYLCEGDLNRSLYWLDDVVFLLKAV